MSISSTGIYGSTALLNSDLFTDLFQDVDDIKQDIEDISTNKIPNLILDISLNLSKINDISNNKIVSIEQNINDITLTCKFVKLTAEVVQGHVSNGDFHCEPPRPPLVPVTAPKNGTISTLVCGAWSLYGMRCADLYGLVTFARCAARSLYGMRCADLCGLVAIARCAALRGRCICVVRAGYICNFCKRRRCHAFDGGILRVFFLGSVQH